jgi:GH43 family beta-xylosidase
LAAFSIAQSLLLPHLAATHTFLLSGSAIELLENNRPMNSCARGVLTLLPMLAPAWGQTAETFQNPVFSSQDPHIAFWQGHYYYTDSDGDRIRIRKSATLTGLARSQVRVVWTSSRRGWDGHANVWAPELHLVDGRWYIYFAADYKTDAHHFLYVLEGGADPLDPYTEGRTGAPDGQIVESTGKWAIDPNVFTGPDGQLYLTWSATDDEHGVPPAHIAIARMATPLRVDSATVRIASPTEPWETRGGPINEGPVGYVRDGKTYITYSGSASWTTNDYSAGLLMNATGDLLDPNAWVKYGPILDGHGKAYGPGSVVLTTSPDGTETWGLYHGYDRLDCRQWSCRSIRMQKVRWNADGTPLFGYPLDPRVRRFLPSGDGKSSTGWGDSRMGTPAAGDWRPESSAAIELAAGADAGEAQAFRGDLDGFSYAFSAEVEERAGNALAEFGVYALYYDAGNFVEAAIAPGAGRFVTRAVAGGFAQPEQAYPLPPDYNRLAPHRLTIAKSPDRQFTFSLDGAVIARRSFPLDFGHIGVFARNTRAAFRGVSLSDTSQGWGNAHGDSAQAMPRTVQPSGGDGYLQGLWRIESPAEVSAAGGERGWRTLYQGDPNRQRYRVQVEARLTGADGIDGPPRYGLIVCHDDRDNQASMWIDVQNRALAVNTVVRGASSWHAVPLPTGFDPVQFHALEAVKRDLSFVFLVDGQEMMRMELGLRNGSAGVATESATAAFRGFRFLTNELGE